MRITSAGFLDAWTRISWAAARTERVHLPGNVTDLPMPLPCPDGTRATVVHPNAAGHANTAEQVETAIRAALQET
ncbi:hypothetical protein SRB5_09480 [Streptomyces sp. RB5]|uniref:Uncharacterized protein n=1 Tax=Streptomyces smaragdinus TaxID=2585196 RepID=A0A7K0CBL8_9ACTN|nr:hypothetical protein [Streptomyces smaragdinus]MQY10835.1 hypothetical protein [Streptomyces smaragdinus]